jgi:hypothetical protein
MVVAKRSGKQVIIRPKQKKKVTIQRVKSNSPSPLSTYRACLSQPFSALAQGARVPDMYSVASATRHITRKFTLVSNSSGECDVVIVPSAFLHAMSPRGSVVGGGTWSTLDGGTVANSTVFTTTASLSAQLTNYRIVGYGVKIIGIASMTTNSGSLTIATLPTEGWLNSSTSVGGQNPNSNNAAMTVTNTLLSYGVPTASNVVSVSALPGLPNTAESSLINVSERPMEVCPKICSPSAFMFRETTDLGPGYGITNQTSATFVSAGNPAYLAVGGLETVVIAATGCPASTSMLDIELVYHLEGIPVVSSTANAVIGSDTTGVAVDPVGWMNVIKDVAAMPSFRCAVETVGNSFFPGLGTMVGKLL